jgi:hypothetical protein
MNTTKKWNKRRRKHNKSNKSNKKTGGFVKKTLICSPYANEKTVKKGETCFTPEVLLEIKKEYNKDHPQNQIKTNEVRELWQELHDRLTKCKGKKETCWLESIDNVELRENIKEHIYAPEQPGDWVKKPNEWLSNYDIDAVLKQYSDVYKDFKAIAPTPIDFDSKRKGGNSCVSDELCKFSLEDWMKKGIKRFGIVFNLDKHTEPGSHWVSLFIDTTNSIMFFFDSAGNGVPKEVSTLMKNIEKQGANMSPPIIFKQYDNGKNDHQKGNTECGMYSLFFLITMLTGKIPSKPDKILTLDKRIDLFLKEKIPDNVVFDYRDLYFNKENL